MVTLEKPSEGEAELMNVISRIGLSVSLFAFASTSFASAEPFSPACGNVLNQIRALLGASLSQANATVIIEHGGRELLNQSFGNEIGTDTEFYLGSVNKSFDAAITLRLLERGRISLDHLVWRDLPAGFAAKLSPQWSKITLRNLLNHTSGIKDFMNHADGADQAHADKVLATPQTFEVLLELAGKNLWFKPDTNLAYSNTNYLILTKIITKVTQTSFPKLLENEVSSRLDLRQTGVASSAGENDLVGNTNIAIPNLEGVGSAFSSARDLMMFLRALDGDTLLSRASIEGLMFRADPRCVSGPACGRYGMGFSLRHETGHFDWVFHEGHLNGVSNMIAKVPAFKLNLALLSDLPQFQIENLTRQIFLELHNSSCLRETQSE